MKNPSVGPGGIAQNGQARAWGPTTAAVIVVLGAGIIALVAFLAIQSGADGGPLQFLVRRERTDARSTIDPDRQAPAPLPPGNVIGKEVGSRGSIPGQANAPAGGLDTRLDGGGGTGPSGAGPAGTRP